MKVYQQEVLRKLEKAVREMLPEIDKDYNHQDQSKREEVDRILKLLEAHQKKETGANG